MAVSVRRFNETLPVSTHKMPFDRNQKNGYIKDSYLQFLHRTVNSAVDSKMKVNRYT